MTAKKKSVEDVLAALLAKQKRQERRIRQLETALDGCLELLADVRYVNWPTKGLGIGLDVNRLDEVLFNGERVLPKSPGRKRKS